MIDSITHNYRPNFEVVYFIDKYDHACTIVETLLAIMKTMDMIIIVGSHESRVFSLFTELEMFKGSSKRKII